MAGSQRSLNNYVEQRAEYCGNCRWGRIYGSRIACFRNEYDEKRPQFQCYVSKKKAAVGCGHWKPKKKSEGE